MKKLLIILLLVLISSCKTRKVELTKDKIHFVDRSVIERKAPADRVYITIPAKEPQRPKAITKTYDGKKGARTDVTFDDDGKVVNIISDCPEVDEKEERDIKYQRDLKLKQIENTFNLDVAKLGSKTIIWVGFFFALAWVARAVVLKK